MRRLALLTAIAVAFVLRGAAAEPLVADLTSHFIAITTGFTGSEVVLFGALDGPGDVVVAVRGPERDIVIRHKSRIAGMWINTNSMTFANAPSFYGIYASRPLDQIAPPGMRSLHQLGVANLRLNPRDDRRPPEEIVAFRNALLDEEERAGLYSAAPGKVSFLGEHLFRATVDFPANVPTGSYRVEVFLFRDREVVTAQTTPLAVSEVGVNAEVNDFAARRALLYGMIAVFGAGVAGWLASLPFRNA